LMPCGFGKYGDTAHEGTANAENVNVHGYEVLSVRRL
jgi:hypothetical protein